MKPLFNRKIAKAMGPLWRQDTRFAIVKYGGGIVQMSGSIGGTTFAKNSTSHYARARIKPVNPNSARQVKIRAILSTLVERWNEILSDAQRAAWATYAAAVTMQNRLGDNIKVSGFNHYIRSNSAYFDAVAQYFDDGPEILALAEQDPAFAIAASAGSQEISVTITEGLAWNSEPGAGMMMYDGRPQSNTRNFFAGPYRGVEWLGGIQPPGNTSPQVHTGIFTLIEGQRIWVKASIIRADGRLSNPMTANCVIAA